MEQLKALDGWTIVHILSGAFLAGTGVTRPQAYALIVGVEVAELVLRRESPFFRESVANIGIDLAASAGTFELVRGARS